MPHALIGGDSLLIGFAWSSVDPSTPLDSSHALFQVQRESEPPPAALLPEETRPKGARHYLKILIRFTHPASHSHRIHPSPQVGNFNCRQGGQFRQLTHSPGVLEVSSTEVLIHLFPGGSYGGEFKRRVSQTLETINQRRLAHPKLPG